MADIKQICAKLIELWDADCDIDVEINELRVLLANAELQVGVTLVIPEMTDTIEKAIEQRKPQPIPVTERRPRLDDCGAEGRCWWGAPAYPDLAPASWRFVSAKDRFSSELYWLPAEAIPTPRSENV